jgi:hypothetical protein
VCNIDVSLLQHQQVGRRIGDVPQHDPAHQGFFGIVRVDFDDHVVARGPFGQLVRPRTRGAALQPRVAKVVWLAIRAVSIGIESGFPRGAKRRSVGGRFSFWDALRRRIGQFVRRFSTEVAPNSSLMQDILQRDRNPL